jgi:cytochrome P450
VHSLGHVVHHLLEWCTQHEGARAVLEADPALLQSFVQESLRLHPSSPIAARIALQRTPFADGQVAAPGDRVIINLRAANRSRERFGADAAAFNPFRTLAGGVDATGLTFGRGMHACLGRTLAAGALGGGSSEVLQRGMLTVLAHRLLCRGITADPDRQARLDRTITRETWATFPVVFHR